MQPPCKKEDFLYSNSHKTGPNVVYPSERLSYFIKEINISREQERDVIMPQGTKRINPLPFWEAERQYREQLFLPFWEKERLLRNMMSSDADRIAKNDVFLPQFSKNKFCRK